MAHDGLQPCRAAGLSGLTSQALQQISADAVRAPRPRYAVAMNTKDTILSFFIEFSLRTLDNQTTCKTHTPARARYPSVIARAARRATDDAALAEPARALRALTQHTHPASSTSRARILQTSEI